jgi:hypothetical protein
MVNSIHGLCVFRNFYAWLRVHMHCFWELHKGSRFTLFSLVLLMGIILIG